MRLATRLGIGLILHGILVPATCLAHELFVVCQDDASLVRIDTSRETVTARIGGAGARSALVQIWVAQALVPSLLFFLLSRRMCRCNPPIVLRFRCRTSPRAAAVAIRPPDAGGPAH